MNRNTTVSHALDGWLLLGIYAAEGALGLSVLALHRLGDRPLFGSLASLTRLSLLAAVVIGTGAVMLMLHRLRHPGRVGRKSQLFTAMLSLITVATAAFVGETAMRLASADEGDVRVFLGTSLLPRRWEAVADRYRDIVREQMDRGELSYLVHDELLGWTTAPNRVSEDGLYFTSTDGVRSPRPGLTLLGPIAGSDSGGVRVALIGDSYTFGLDVTYEDTWGHRLELLLGPGVWVRNFGVPGYGVDQAVLRYERDVRPWKPDIVVLAPISHDFVRTMAVYMFVDFPRWDYPFAKPRFLVRDGALVLLDSATVRPELIFDHPSITDLPAIEYDVGFAAEDWRFRPYHHSLLIRFFRSRHPAWRTAPDSMDASMSEEAVNGAILRRFVSLALADGAVPMLAYLPAVDQLAPGRSTSNSSEALIRSVALATGALHTDATVALAGAGLTNYRSKDGRGMHYSAEANGVVAEHFASFVAQVLGDLAASRGNRPGPSPVWCVTGHRCSDGR